jgi:hypothetical protein
LLDAVSVQQLHVQQPSTYAKPEAASAVLGSWWWAVCRPKPVGLHINGGIIIFWYILACSNDIYTPKKNFLCFVHQLHVQQPSTYEEPEATIAVLGSWWWAVCRPEAMWAAYKYEMKFWYTVAFCWILFVEMLKFGTAILFGCHFKIWN